MPPLKKPTTRLKYTALFGTAFFFFAFGSRRTILTGSVAAAMISRTFPF
jgi:hypothetical protein